MRFGASSAARRVVVYGLLPPTRLKLRPWFKEKSLVKLVEGTKHEQLAIDIPG